MKIRLCEYCMGVEKFVEDFNREEEFNGDSCFFSKH